VATNPLTGVSPRPTGPVIAVKLDDTAPGRPTLGLERADVIYIEQAEGGLTRMVAVFASAKPQVRAVRSVRSSDSELLRQYGRIIVVASGGGGSSLPTLDRSTLHSAIFDRAEVGFFRDQSRPAPYNVVSDLAKVSATIKADGVRNVGFTWAVNDPRLAGAKSAPTVSLRVGSTPVGFVWDPKLARYVRTVDGWRIRAASGAPVAKPNVLVQFCQISADRSDIDVNGSPSMFTRSVPQRQANRRQVVPPEPGRTDDLHRQGRPAAALRSGRDVRGSGGPGLPFLMKPFNGMLFDQVRIKYSLIKYA